MVRNHASAARGAGGEVGAVDQGQYQARGLALDLKTSKPRIIAFATKGAGTNEEDRLRALLSNHAVDFFAFDRSGKFKSFRALLRALKSGRYELAVMEGTGIAGGVALIWSKWLGRCRYVVSSGDAVAPWVASIRKWLGPIFLLYEKKLCKNAAGFIGWTPYLVGRAMTFGTPRGVTAPGWALHPKSPDAMLAARRELRSRHGIADSTIVFGIVGSLAWNARVGFLLRVRALARHPQDHAERHRRSHRGRWRRGATPEAACGG